MTDTPDRIHCSHRDCTEPADRPCARCGRLFCMWHAVYPGLIHREDEQLMCFECLDRAEISRTAPRRASLRRLAESHPPPPEWFDDTEDGGGPTP